MQLKAQLGRMLLRCYREDSEFFPTIKHAIDGLGANEQEQTVSRQAMAASESRARQTLRQILEGEPAPRPSRASRPPRSFRIGDHGKPKRRWLTKPRCTCGVGVNSQSQHSSYCPMRLKKKEDQAFWTNRDRED